jgi:hypothetical protein
VAVFALGVCGDAAPGRALSLVVAVCGCGAVSVPNFVRY